MDLERVVPLVVEFLEGKGHPFAVAGALGLHAHGVTRATLDLDLVTVREAREALVGFLEGAGYETLYSSEGYSNHVHGDPALGRVDISIAICRRRPRTLRRSTACARGGRSRPSNTFVFSPASNPRARRPCAHALDHAGRPSPSTERRRPRARGYGSDRKARSSATQTSGSSIIG